MPIFPPAQCSPGNKMAFWWAVVYSPSRGGCAWNKLGESRADKQCGKAANEKSVYFRLIVLFDQMFVVVFVGVVN